MCKQSLKGYSIKCMHMQEKQTIVFLGATGAVGSIAFHHLLSSNKVSRILTLGRRAVDVKEPPAYLEQKLIDIHHPSSYADEIRNCNIAICTLGVGEPSKVSKADFIAIDKTAVLNFAKICKENGVKQFHLLSSVGSSSRSRNYYLRTKGELEDELARMDFDRLSIFHPSMIMTPQNRYGFTQALALFIWPKLDIFLHGGARKYRGIKVDMLGKSIANNVFIDKQGVEYLRYDDFLKLQG
ncbi:MAG: NAD(P)H-binding protein [Bacteroidota bacterium]